MVKVFVKVQQGMDVARSHVGQVIFVLKDLYARAHSPDFRNSVFPKMEPARSHVSKMHIVHLGLNAKIKFVSVKEAEIMVIPATQHPVSKACNVSVHRQVKCVCSLVVSNLDLVGKPVSLGINVKVEPVVSAILHSVYVLPHVEQTEAAKQMVEEDAAL